MYFNENKNIELILESISYGVSIYSDGLLKKKPDGNYQVF